MQILSFYMSRPLFRKGLACKNKAFSERAWLAKIKQTEGCYLPWEISGPNLQVYQSTLTLAMLNKLRCHAHLVIVSQSDYLIQIANIRFAHWMINSADPADLKLHCLQRHSISGFNRSRVKINTVWLNCNYWYRPGWDFFPPGSRM